MLINIEKIKINDRIRKDFGNIEELAEDIKENGLINPPVVTPDTFELIAGERRLKAMKLLGYKQIEVRPMAVKDAEHQLNLEISENETRKDFSKSERIDYARRLERVESLKAKERKGIHNTTDVENFPHLTELGRTRDIVANKLGIGSGKQYEKEKFIVDNKDVISVEDFANWDEGKLSTNKVFTKIKSQLNEMKENNQELLQQLKNKEKLCDELKNKIVTPTIETDNLYFQDTASILVANCSEITTKIRNFLDDMGKFDYLSESFNQIPDSIKTEYIRHLNAINSWTNNILNNIEKSTKYIVVEGEQV